MQVFLPTQWEETMQVFLCPLQVLSCVLLCVHSYICNKKVRGMWGLKLRTASQRLPAVALHGLQGTVESCNKL